MPITTVLARNPELGLDENINGWRAFIYGGGWTTEQSDIIVEALMSAQRAALGDLLSEECTWQPSTSEIIGPIGADIETASWLVNESSRIVIDNAEEIIDEALAATSEDAS